MPKPFLTPPSTPVEVQCRTLRIPQSKFWLGIFNSALYEMTNSFNYEQVNDTDLTIEDTIAIVEQILIDFFNTTGCTTDEVCALPSGGAMFRLDANGHYQELTPEGWVEPFGDSTVPTLEARTETTTYERKCLAAMNAANVLKELYEVVSDQVSEDADAAQVQIAIIAYLTAALGGWIAAPAVALLEIIFALLIVFIEIAEYMTADLWDAEFTALLECVLYNCATDDAGVVTFDFTCVNDTLASGVDLSALDALNQLRLFGQVSFMLSVIGADGLNLAGETTAITVATCDCAVDWCAEFVFTVDEQGWVAASGYESLVSYVAGVGWKPANTANSGIIAVRLTFPDTQHIYSVGVHINTPMTGNLKRVYYAPNGSIYTGANSYFYNMGSSVSWGLDLLEGDYEWIEVGFQNGSPNASYPKDFALFRVVVNGHGINPYPEFVCEP